MIRVSGNLAIDESEVRVRFVRSSGPGGQNVNKVATACELRFDVASSPSLPEEVKGRLRALAGSRLTGGGEILIDARRHRTQLGNRREALARLLELLRQAAKPPKKRHPTRPTAASRLRRLEAKKRRGSAKRLRQAPPGE